MQNEPLIFDIESLEMRITSTLRRLFADAMLARGDSERADATKNQYRLGEPEAAFGR